MKIFFIIFTSILIVVDISNLDSLLHKVFCNILGLTFKTICPDFYDLPIWEVAVAFGTIAAAYFAYTAILESNKRLKIEQTPHVVLDCIIRENNRYGFVIKNIGRGPAVHITFSTGDDISKRNNGFFSNDQPHSANFYPFEKSHDWYVDGRVLDDLKHEHDYAYLYIFYSSQYDALFMTKVKIKRILKEDNDVTYVVMENKVEELPLSASSTPEVDFSGVINA